MASIENLLNNGTHQKVSARLTIPKYNEEQTVPFILDSFSVYKLSGVSSVLEGYSYFLDFISDAPVKVENIVDLDAQIYLKDETRPLNSKKIHGKIFQAKENGSVGRKKVYTIQIVSPLYYLSLNKRYEIYQEKTVPEIITSIISKFTDVLNIKLEIKIDLQGISKRHTCTQYGQSDFDFIKMLCKEEGFVLLYDASTPEHYSLTLCELNEHAPLMPTSIKCNINYSKKFSTSAQVQDFYENKVPSLDLSTAAGNIANNAKHRDNELTSQLRNDIKNYVQRDRIEKLDESLAKDLFRYAKIDADRGVSQGIRIRGNSEEISLCDGYNARLLDTKGHKSEQAIILSITTQATFPNALDEYVEEGGGESPAQYSVDYVAIPSDLIYKPQSPTDKPRIEGVITAIVSNGDNKTQSYANEIDANEFGDIRVIFHFDENRPTSAYIPLSKPYGGDGYGMQFIPRVNSEVIVEFINGDIDRPIITGALHNGENRHPYSLPKEKTKSFIKTQTTPQYEDEEGYNELLFEDKQNNELLSLRAQNDYKLHALNNANTHFKNTAKTIIGNDSEFTVQNDLSMITGNDSRVNIGRNSLNTIEKEEITTVKEDAELNILKDQISIINENQTTIVQQDLIERIKGFATLYVEQDAKEKYLQNLFTQVGAQLGLDVTDAFELKAESIKETANTIDLDGAKGVSLKVGGNVLTVDSSGVHFKTPMYDANSSNGGVTSSAVAIKDLVAPLYQKYRVTEITGIQKQSEIDETLTYTAKVEKFENGEWVETTSLEQTQKIQINWVFIKNNELMDTDIISDNLTNDELEKEGLKLTVSLQEDNTLLYAHVHAYFSDPENEGYFNTELKRNIEVEEIKGDTVAQVNDVLKYTIKLNVDNPTKDELTGVKAEIVSIDKEDKETRIQHPLDESLTLACQTDETLKAVKVKTETSTKDTDKITEIRPLHENERANLHISSESENYIFKIDHKTTKLNLDEDINQEEGTALIYHFVLKDGGGKPYISSEKEAYIENKQLKAEFDLEELTKEVGLELSHLASFSAYVDIEGDTKNTGKVSYSSILKDDVWKNSSILNASADASKPQVYKKGKNGTPNSKGDEVKRIQEALQKLNINIGDDGVDDVFGKDGHNATMTFQDNYKPSHNVHQYTWAEPDGIVGKNTLLALDEALVSGWRYVEPEKINWADTLFGKTLGKVESKNDYSAYNKTKGGLKSYFNTKLTEMTIKEIQQKQKTREMFAVGRFQIITKTLILAVNTLKIDTSVKFNKTIQDKIFNEYLITKKRPAIIAYLKSDGSIDSAMYDWAKEFASAAVKKGNKLHKRKNDKTTRIAKGGESYYAGDGLNKAHLSLDEMEKALKASKNKGK